MADHLKNDGDVPKLSDIHPTAERLFIFKKNNKFYLFVLILVFLLFTGIAIKIFGISNKKATDNTINNTASNHIDTGGWKTFNDHGLYFLYPPDWEFDSFEPEPGNEKNLSFIRREPDGITNVMDIHIERNYDPLPAVSDPLQSFYTESVTSKVEKIPPVMTFKNRKAIRYLEETDDIYQDVSFIAIDAPEISGALSFYFPDTSATNTLSHEIEQYFEPLLLSLVIRDLTWPKTPSVLTAESNLDTSRWKKYTGTDFTFSYPGNWKVTAEKDPDFADTTNIILTKYGGEVNYGNDIPQITIGSPTVFSTSGALCANDSCADMGAAEVKIREKTYFGTILDKNDRDTSISAANFYPSLYVFRIEPNRVPSKPSITALFKDLKQGQEIVNILSTFNY